jgi:hypothetical protein
LSGNFELKKCFIQGLKSTPTGWWIGRGWHRAIGRRIGLFATRAFELLQNGVFRIFGQQSFKLITHCCQDRAHARIGHPLRLTFLWDEPIEK